MSDCNETTPSQSSCGCQWLIEMTSASTLSDLDNRFVDSLTHILGSKRFQICYRNDTVALVSKAQVKTTFDLPDPQLNIARICVEQNLNDEVTDSIQSLLKIYQNQSLLIRRINHDQLTRLGNRHALENKFHDLQFQGENKRKKAKPKVCLALFDIDHFKAINDQFGHLYGDEVLVQLSQLMIKTFRDSDFLFRYGGEEFVVILTDLNLEQGHQVLERFRKQVATHNFPLVGKVTISIGLTELVLDSGAMSVIGRADQALYFAKENGRNRLCVYERLVAEGKLTQNLPTDDDITLFH